MRHRDRTKKYFWVACAHKDVPGCEECPHAEPHQARLEDGFSCPGECQHLGAQKVCVPTRRKIEKV
jgi:hypothetical protein